jgi:hypothetical protein
MRILARIPWILLLLLGIAVALSIRPIADTDILWHLRTGQWMLAHGDVIRQDVFSATRLGCEWVSVPWLYELMLAKLHGAFGWGGPTVWQVLMVAGITWQTAWLVWLLRRRAGDEPRSGRWDWHWPCLTVPAAVAVLLMLRLLQMRINGRPELFSYLFLGAYLIVLTVAEKRREAKPGAARRYILWLLPLLQVVWTNTHGAFLIGPAVVGAYAGAAWLAYLAARWQVAGAVAAPWRLTAVTTVTILACLATPYGLAGTFYPFHLFDVLTDPLYKYGVVEGQPVELATLLESGGMGYTFFGCLVFALLGAMGRLLEAVRGEGGAGALVFKQDSGFRVQGDVGVTDRELGAAIGCGVPVIHGGYLVVCLAMGWLSLAAVRNLPLVGLVAAPLVADGLAYAADGLAAMLARVVGGVRRRLARGRHRGGCSGADGVDWLHSRPVHLAAQLLLAVVLLLIYRAIVSERFYASLGWRMRFAVGYSDHEHPLAAADFVAQHRAAIASRTLYGDTRSANLFLARFGPGWPVYFDGRHAEIYPPPIFRTAAKTRFDVATFEREAAKYGIGLVCFSLTDLKEDRSPLAVALGQTNTWRLVYLDDCAALFAANSASQAPLVSRYGLVEAPTNALWQRRVFGEWLERQGRPNLMALDDPANRELEEGGGRGGWSMPCKPMAFGRRQGNWPPYDCAGWRSSWITWGGVWSRMTCISRPCAGLRPST